MRLLVVDTADGKPETLTTTDYRCQREDNGQQIILNLFTDCDHIDGLIAADVVLVGKTVEIDSINGFYGTNAKIFERGN